MSEERGPRKIEWALLAVMAAMASTAVLATGGFRIVDFAIIEYFMAAALGISILRVWFHQEPVFHLSPVFWAMAVFVLYVTIRFALADIHYVAEEEWTRMMLYVAFFILFTFHLFRPQYTHALLLTVAVVAVGSSLYAAYQYFTNSNKVWHFIRPEMFNRRGSGTFINPNNLAGYVAVLLPMMIAVVMVARVNIITRCLAAYAGFMFLVGLGATASRGGIFAAGIGMIALVVMLVRLPAFRMSALIMLAVLLLGGFAVLSRADVAQARLQKMQSTNLEQDGRFLVWQSAEEMWRDHLWLGVGPGHYDSVFPQYRPEILQQRKPLFAHNEYLNTLADYGIVGALLVLAAVVAAELAFRYGWRNLKRESTSRDGARSNRLALLMGGAAGITAALAHALFDYNFHIPAYALLLMFFTGILAVAWRTDNTRWWWRPQLSGKAVLTALSLALAVWFGMHAHKRTKEAALLAGAERTKPGSPEHLQFLEAAFKVEPRNGFTAHAIGVHYMTLAALNKPTEKDALEWFAKAGQLDPHDSYVPLHQAVTHILINETKDVKSYLDDADRLNPKDYYTLAQIGWCYFRLMNYEEAIRYFERSLRLRDYANPTATELLPLSRELLEQQRRLKQP
ncbi:MAG TPA: O-antigen ligase family protein [Verrucomicrobiae bacterium]